MKKYLLIFFLPAFLFFLSAFSFAAAQEALPEQITSIPKLIQYFFRQGMIIAASLAILVLVYGAFRYMISGGNPGTKADAKDRMYKAVIGLIILLSSFLILEAVNPELRVLKVEPLLEIKIPKPPPEPGVYVYKNKNCSGAFRVYTTSSNLGEGFSNEVECIKILNDPDNDIFYGVILHEKDNFQGLCSDIFFDEPGPVNPSYSSITVFRRNIDWRKNAGGVVFYSHPYTEYKGGGYYTVKLKSELYEENPEVFEFKYQGTDVPAKERQKKRNFFRSSGSMNLLDNYLVVFKTTANYCQVFNRDAQNLKTEWIIAKYGGNQLYKISVIPIK